MKEKIMENISRKRKKCETDGCEKQPIFNTRGKTKGRFCSKHKEPDMVDIQNKKCETDGVLIF